MKKKRKRLIIALLVILLVLASIVVGLVLLRSAGKKAVQERISQIEDSDNAETLRRLNSDWTLPENYSLDFIDCNGIVMEWMQDNKGSSKAILQLHGGAYTRSLKDNGITYRRSAAQYIRISGASVLTPDYRVAPEYPYPAALEDALTAYEWLLEQGFEPASIIIAGDSAGGGLALALTLYLRDHNLPLPSALITMSPWTNLNYKRFTPSYARGSNAADPYISPLYGDYFGFPPMLMQVGGDEALLNDTISVAVKAEDAGVELIQTTYPGMFHVFQMLFPDLSSANDAWDEVSSFINMIFEN